MKKKRLLLAGGARPNFVKLAGLIEELKLHRNRFTCKIVHTEQHSSYLMSEVFFKELNIPRPDYFLTHGRSRSITEQKARIIDGFYRVLMKEKPDLAVVVGDVTSTAACSIAASNLNIPVAHIEAGLRSFDPTMPEEINRIVTDALSAFLFTTCRDADINLAREGIPKSRIFFTGNIMIDTLVRFRSEACASNILRALKVKPKDYAVLTLHRPVNVDTRMPLERIFGALKTVAGSVRIIFPVHPRTASRMKSLGIGIDNRNIKMVKPLGYLDFLKLEADARFVLTDSGGIQEETTFLKVPCLTLRENTERPVTIKEGTNKLVGTDKKNIIAESLKILGRKKIRGKIPELWDGRAAARIVKVLKEKL